MAVRVSYTEDQIKYIKQTLARDSNTIKLLLKYFADSRLEIPLCKHEDEIATCIRILETKGEITHGAV